MAWKGGTVRRNALVSLLALVLVLTGCTRPPYAVNENGQTYGTLSEAHLDEPGLSTEEWYQRIPDLILAQATNGKEGYVTKGDLLSGKSPIPVYEADGETQIGVLINDYTGRESDLP